MFFHFYRCIYILWGWRFCKIDCLFTKIEKLKLYNEKELVEEYNDLDPEFERTL